MASNIAEESGVAVPANLPDSQEAEELAKAKESMTKCWHVERPRFFVVNPVVTIGSIVILWGFVISCAASPDYMLKGMQTVAFDWIPEVWTWLYIVSQDIWIIVLVYVMVISKYGNIKLGKDDEEPEYSFATWFSMLFSAGVAVGLFYYSVAEPVWHYKGYGDPRFKSSVKGYGNDNEDATHALMVTWYHWGLHGWIPYTTMGAVLAIMTYRRGFPMTIRYCLWPLIGDRCYGWIGDTVDVLSIVTTIAGVCTSLGLGAMQINQGLQRLNHGLYQGQNFAIPESDPKYSDPTCGGTGSQCLEGQEAYGIQVNVLSQILIIVVVTLAATASVVSGLNTGIVNLSRFNFMLGMGLLLMVLFLGETWFILDSLVQSFGYYLWYLLRIGFHTDAFARLGDQNLGLGGAPDDKGADAGWLTGWTLFYWGWWISWGPFVGTFLAKISRGRTVRQFVLGTLIVPTLYSFLWFGVLGSEGIRMQRMADSVGLCDPPDHVANCTGASVLQSSSNCKNYAAQFSLDDKKNLSMGWTPDCVLDPAYHNGFGKCKEFKWTRKTAVGSKCVETTSWEKVPCGANTDPTELTVLKGACVGDITLADINGGSFNLFPPANNPDCFVPAPDNLVCLNNQGTTDIFFDLLSSYGPRGFSDLISVVALIALVLYFVTSSDSGSLVVDMISANGHPEPPVLQRIFWSFTEGATAAALLYAGKNLPNSDGSLRALQSASIIAGLPYTFILFWCSQSLYLLCKEESGELSADRKAFDSFIFSVQRPLRLLYNTALPGITMGRIIERIGGWPLHAVNPVMAMRFWASAFQSMYAASIILLFCGFAISQWCTLALVIYIGFATFAGFLRTSVRTHCGILHGDMLTDFLCACFAPMCLLTQIEEQLSLLPEPLQGKGAEANKGIADTPPRTPTSGNEPSEI